MVRSLEIVWGPVRGPHLHKDSASSHHKNNNYDLTVTQLSINTQRSLPLQPLEVLGSNSKTDNTKRSKMTRKALFSPILYFISARNNGCIGLITYIIVGQNEWMTVTGARALLSVYARLLASTEWQLLSCLLSHLQYDA
jgi:hypothetical protein